MSNKPGNLRKQKKAQSQVSNPGPPKILPVQSLLDQMVDGREFESLISHQFTNINVVDELRKSIAEIETSRNRPLVCYVANVVKPRDASISIDSTDDLPFNEMIDCIPPEVEEIDVVLVTPGGSASQVVNFVNALRPRFKKVGFIILNKAMSAGTIFCMSGEEIIMSSQSQIGPIDPQVKTASGDLVPAQSVLTLIEEIKLKGENLIKHGLKPSWADILILRGIDPKEIGNAISASNYSIQLTEEYLNDFKFKNWTTHSNGNPVTPTERKDRANEIAKLLCEHSVWKSHGHAITRKAAWDVCKLKITHSENVAGLNKAMRRMWALYYWIFENTTLSKVFISKDYSIFRKFPTENLKKP